MVVKLVPLKYVWQHITNLAGQALGQYITGFMVVEHNYHITCKGIVVEFTKERVSGSKCWVFMSENVRFVVLFEYRSSWDL